MFAKFSTMFNNVKIPGQGQGPPGPGRPRNDGGGGGSGSGSNLRAGTSRSSSLSSSSSSPSSSKKHCARSNNDKDTTTEGDLQTCQVDNSKAVIAKIAALYAERLMSDITLVINRAEFPAHRLILCASSDVFQVMLMNPNWSESQESRVVLQESAECAESFEDFLKYLYTGRLKLELSSVIYLLMLADKYNVKDLIELCLTYMHQHVPSAANYSQLVIWFQYTSSFGQQHGKVAESCRNYIKWNLELVAQAEDFPHLELELFSSILSEDDVVVSDEFHLYQILEYWIDCQIEKYRDRDSKSQNQNQVNLDRIVDRTMQYIRFPMMTPRQLADLIASPLIRRHSSLMGNMAIAMGFHNGQLEDFTEPILEHPQKSKLFKPRLYCTDQWSVCIVAPFDRLQHYQSQTLVFTTPSSFSETCSSSDKQVEWCLDFYPKAVQFQKFYLIGWHGTTEMPEHVLKTVRLSILCKSEESSDVRVQIGVLIAGLQDGIEHVRNVVQKKYIFSETDRVLNMDNLLPYGDLSPCATCIRRNQHQPNQHPSSTSTSHCEMPVPQSQPTEENQSNFCQQNTSTFCNSCNCSSGSEKSCYFVGPHQNLVKIRIVITPMKELDV